MATRSDRHSPIRPHGHNATNKALCARNADVLLKVAASVRKGTVGIVSDRGRTMGSDREREPIRRSADNERRSTRTSKAYARLHAIDELVKCFSDVAAHDGTTGARVQIERPAD